MQGQQDGRYRRIAPPGAPLYLERALSQALGVAFDIRAQLPLALESHSVPEPDIAVVRGHPRDYRDAHPQHAGLIVEVADASLAYDRGRKLAAYARAGIPEDWVLNLSDSSLEICGAPRGSSIWIGGSCVLANACRRWLRPARRST